MQKTLQTLFKSYKLGDVTLSNRFAMSSLTRVRADPSTGVANDLHVEYYSQRAGAGLILSEATAISRRGDPAVGCAAIYTKQQVEGWKRVTDAVHNKGSKMFAQLWHGGRMALIDPATGQPPFAPSAVAVSHPNFGTGLPYDQPKEMTKDEIKLVLDQYRQAAKNAVEAGFDGVELHGANGYLIDQFLRDFSNKRTDEYGGSVENRSRLCLEVIDAMIDVVGPGRVGIKLSPVCAYGDMHDSDPVALFSHLLKQLEKKGIAYIQLREPEPTNPTANEKEAAITEVCKTFRPYFKGTIMVNERQTPENVIKMIEEGSADLASFGRSFISNPDFVERVRNGWELNNNLDFTKLFGGGAFGYIDYPFYQQN